MKILCDILSLKSIFNACDVERLDYAEVRDNELIFKAIDEPARKITIQRIDAASDRIYTGVSGPWVSTAQLIEQLPDSFEKAVILIISRKMINVVFECV